MAPVWHPCAGLAQGPGPLVSSGDDEAQPPACLASLVLLAAALSLLPSRRPSPTARPAAGSSKKKHADVRRRATATHVQGLPCADGSTKYAARDFAGAVASFQKAIEVDPKNPLGHYFLGEAQLAAGNMTEAEAAWNRASLEASEKDPALRAKILFVLADLKERQHKWDDARAAWQVYLDWVAKYREARATPAAARRASR